MARPRIIDMHCHVHPPEIAKADPLWPNGDCPICIETLLDCHEKAGIDFAVATNSLHYLKGKSDEQCLEGLKRWHEYAAEIQSKYSDRIACFAGTIPTGGDAFNREFERAITQLGLKGAFINSSHNGHYPDEDSARPFLKLACDLDVPVMIHAPPSSFGESCMNMYRLISSVGRPMDESLAIARMIVRGVFEQLPSLKLIACHVGGGICEVLPRMDYCYELGDYCKFLGKYEPMMISKKPSDYARDQLYFDTASYSAPVIKLGIETVGVEKMVFGSDAPPLVPLLPKMRGLIESLKLPPDQQEAIFTGNASRLLKIPA